MGRSIEADVHAAFVEFRAGDGDKCVSAQCIYCQQVRAKNTTRQRAHLLRCEAYLQAHPDVALQVAAERDGEGETYPDPTVLEGTPAGHTSLGFMPNPRINSTPIPGRPSLSRPEGTPLAKKPKLKHGGNLADISLKEVHAAFEEFKAKDDDKGISARCLYCDQVRAKNTSRQREHLMVCPGYQTVLKEKIPANNLRHQFEDDDVASSLSIPMPTLDLDFRMSIMVKPKVTVGDTLLGREAWVSCVGGRWAGRWGKGIILPSGQHSQTTVSETKTRISAKYLMQTTGEEDPVFFTCTLNGWWIADKDVMDKLQDPIAADNMAASRYKLRVTMELETGNERYSSLNGGIYVGSGCRRGAEIVYDFYRVS
ncbi:hypothetical protein QBC47DRAFT_166755 [Echria macrotheca]|uniref:Uncharacterized protein n=1 Tax=Echria macrotheca TaxID=438768 RepID=A0AAJ0BGP5_9PEZI|nr:hypothetical protein QBC47DRAFT_166755 [Echria macrotheca]